MKITSVRPVVVGNPWKNWVFAIVETDEGVSGLGEGSVHGFPRTIASAVEELGELVTGEDPRRIDWLSRRMLRDLYTDGGQLHRAAAAAIEIACWDILGRSLATPIWQLLGGRVRERVRAYANGWYQSERDPESFAARAREVVGAGYTALKLDPFGSAWRILGRDDLGLSLELMAAVRDAVGPGVDVLVEGHCRFTAAQAIEIAERLVPYSPTWFEEPVRHERVGGVAEVALRSPVPIATGESFHTLGEFAELAARAPIGFWQPEPAHLGGIGPTRQVFALVEAYDGVVAPHQAGGPVATAVCLHLAASSSNHYIQEHFDEYNVPWTRDLLSWRPELDAAGTLPVPEGPGLGVTLNLDEVARHPHDRRAVLELFRDGWEKRDPHAQRARG